MKFKICLICDLFCDEAIAYIMSEEREILVLLLQLRPEASAVFCFTSYNFSDDAWEKKKKPNKLRSMKA